MKKNPRAWSEPDRQYVRDHFASNPTADVARAIGRTSSQVSQCAARLGLRKSEAYLASPASCRLRAGISASPSTQFRKGMQPWNAGKKGYDPGGRCSGTQFKHGFVGGAAAANYQQIGTERVSKDGILYRKVADTGARRERWKPVHAAVWEESNGRIPCGHIVVFRDGDRSNFRVENLELISRAENMRRNTVHQWGKEIASLCQLKGAVARQINKRTEA